MPLRRAYWLLLAAFPAVVSAQDPRAAQLAERARNAMGPLAGLIGQWEGDARAVTGPGQPMAIRQSEDITWGAGRTVIIIKGTGRSPDGASAGAIVFEAAAIAWYDADSNRVRMRAHRDGRVLDVNVEVRPDTMAWGFAVPGGRVRYVIAFGGDSWHEVGHFLREGAPPVQTIEMRLSRKK